VSSSVETCHNFPLELKQWICLLQVGLAMVVVESAVTSIYICYAEDPLLIHRWDAEFFNQLSEALHQRLQHRSSRAREVLTQNRLNVGIQENVPLWQASPKQILSRNTHCNSLYYIPSIEVLESFCFSLVWDLDCIKISWKLHLFRYSFSSSFFIYLFIFGVWSHIQLNGWKAVEWIPLVVRIKWFFRLRRNRIGCLLRAV
jgi:hypothetical protein